MQVVDVYSIIIVLRVSLKYVYPVIPQIFGLTDADGAVAVIIKSYCASTCNKDINISIS